MSEPIRNFVKHGEAPHPWERYLGSDAQDRTKQIGQTGIDFRENILKIPVSAGDKLAEHTEFIHKLGAHALQVQVRLDNLRETGEKSPKKLDRIIPRRVRVEDSLEEDNGKSHKSAVLSLDEDWGAVNWTDEMVTSACETLFMKFKEPTFLLDETRRTKAVAMLEKLVKNHAVGEFFVKQNIECMMKSSTSRLLRGGRSSSAFNFLYIINISKEKCCKELTEFTFSGKCIEMMLLESRLAAILIQNTYRSSKLKTQIKQSIVTTSKESNPHKESGVSEEDSMEATSVLSIAPSTSSKNVPRITSYEFGTDKEMRGLKEWHINARSSDMRNRWRSLHWNRTALTFDVGIRGPAHIGSTFTKLLLEIMAYIVSDAAGSHAGDNRVDVVNTYGCIILSVLLSNVYGPFAATVASILSDISKAWESLLPLLNCGCLNQIIKYMKHLRSTHENLIKPSNIIRRKASKGTLFAAGDYDDGDAMSTSTTATARDLMSRGEKMDKHRAEESLNALLTAARASYTYCVEVAMQTAEHAAGLMRVHENVTSRGFIVERLPAKKTGEPIDYRTVAATLQGVRSGPKGGWDVGETVTHMLGTKALLNELMLSLIETIHVPLLKTLLKTLFSLACCECFPAVVIEVVANGGKGLIRLIELLEEEDCAVSGYVLGLLLQLCTLSSGRDALVAAANVPKLLSHLLESHGQYGSRSHQRGVLFAAALCRQQDWWAMDALDISPFLLQSRSNKAESALRGLVLRDIVRTMKAPKNEHCDDLTLADLNVLRIDYKDSLDMSKMAEIVGSRSLANFVCHPDDEGYFESLQWDESIAGCAVLEGLTLHPGTTETIFSLGAIRYLGKCLRVAKVLFVGPPMSDRRTIMMLNGVASAANALAQFCFFAARSTLPRNATMTAKIICDSDVMTATRFFIRTLAVSHPQLDEGTKRLQQEMGIAVVKFFGAFTRVLQDTAVDMDNLSIGTFSTTASCSTKSEITVRKGETLKEKEADMSALAMNPQLAAVLPAGLAITQLMKSLPVVYGRTEKMFEILAEISDLLSRLTLQRVGAYTAIHEWKVIEALRANLPPTLSGVREMGVRNPLYQTGLGAIPAPYFTLCANLCQMVVFKVSAISEGFLRRALEKIMLLAPYLEDDMELGCWKEMLIRGDAVPVSVKRVDVGACLQFVSATANYQAESCGAANDLIFHSDYDIMRVCRDIVAVDGCPRCDSLLVIAAETLAALSRDNIRLYQELLDLELLELVLLQFDKLSEEFVPDDTDIGMWRDTLPDRLVSACIEIIVNLVTGVWCEKLADVIHCVREPLARLARVRPHFLVKVRDANWEITQGAATYKHTRGSLGSRDCDVRYVGDVGDISQRPYSDSDMTGEFTGSDFVTPGSPVRYSTVPASTTSKQLPDLSFTSRSSSILLAPATAPSQGTGGIFNKSTPRASTPEGSAPRGLTPRVQSPGRYSLCGVSSCGSLRCVSVHDVNGNHTHGQFMHLTDAEREAQLLCLPLSDGGRAAVSKIPMNESSLVEKLRRAKISNGFASRSAGSLLTLEGDSPKKDTGGTDTWEFDTERDRSGKYFVSSVVKSPVATAVKKPRSTFGDYVFQPEERERARPSAPTLSSSRYVESPYDPYAADAIGMILPVSREKESSPCKSAASKSGVNSGVGKRPGREKEQGADKSSKDTINSIDTDDFPELVMTRPPMMRGH